MKKIIFGLLILFLTMPAFATQASRYNTYGLTDQVTATNLNGNWDNILSVVNGNLDNTNAKTGSGFRFYEVLGSLPTAGTEGRLVYLTTDDKLYTDNGSAFSVLNSFKIGTFTRDTATASGTQAVTGVGFQPTQIEFFMGGASTKEMSVGFDNGTNRYCVAADDGASADTWVTSENNSIASFITRPTTQYVGYVSSLDADGFTLTWTKTGSPTGTITIQYRAYK